SASASGPSGNGVERFQAEGPAGLEDRSSRPHRLRAPTPEATCEQIVQLRRRRWTAKHVAETVGVSPATVSRVLRRAGLHAGHERSRGSGWELVHVCIDDASRLAFT